jgi:hypothetical protein
MLGLVAGAVAGGGLIAFGPTGGGGALIGLFAALVLALYLPLVFVPLWWCARSLRLPDLVGAPASGASSAQTQSGFAPPVDPPSNLSSRARFFVYEPAMETALRAMLAVALDRVGGEQG